MWQAGRPARLPRAVPKRGRKHTGQLSVQPISMEVCLLSKPPRRPSYAPRGPGVEPACLEEQDHTESPAGRPGRLLIVCVCWGGWLPLGSSHPHMLSPVPCKVGCQNSARAPAGHGLGRLCAATRALSHSINSRGITFRCLSGRCA